MDIDERLRSVKSKAEMPEMVRRLLHGDERDKLDAAFVAGVAYVEESIFRPGFIAGPALNALCVIEGEGVSRKPTAYVFPGGAEQTRPFSPLPLDGVRMRVAGLELYKTDVNFYELQPHIMDAGPWSAQHIGRGDNVYYFLARDDLAVLALDEAVKRTPRKEEPFRVEDWTQN